MTTTNVAVACTSAYPDAACSERPWLARPWRMNSPEAKHGRRRRRRCHRAANSSFELALDIHPAEVNDLASLRENGWQLTDPKRAAATPEAFREFVRGSDAEFSVAQGIYVETNSGWFSDRTTRYLAAGRPVLVQDTGFSRRLPCGEGLVPFTNVDEAAAGAERIAANYEAHCAAARAVAERCFDARAVLKRVLDVAGVGT